MAFEQLQEMFAVVSRLQCLLDELCEVRLLYPNLSNCHVKPDGSALELRFLDLSLKRFCAVEVKISSDYPASQPAVTAHVQFPSDQAVSEESTQKIAFGAARGYGQVGRICTIVSEALAID